VGRLMRLRTVLTSTVHGFALKPAAEFDVESERLMLLIPLAQ